MIKAIRRHPWVMRAAVTSLVVGVVGVGVVLAEDLWVNNVYVDIRHGHASYEPVIGRANQGEKLTVVERQDDWAHVKYKDLDGWVMVSDLSDKPVGATSMSGLGDSTSTGSGNAMAAKGFTEHEYALQKGYSEAPFNALEAQYDVSKPTTLVKPDDMKAFMAAGKVGRPSMRGNAPPPAANPANGGNPLSPS